MGAEHLPYHAPLAEYVKQADELFAGWQAGDERAVRVFRSKHPKFLDDKIPWLQRHLSDAEARAMFCGYNTVHYKVAIFTLSAVLCGIAGALYVPQVGIINPSEMSPANSIELAIWVAVGGRGSLAGAILGAGLVNGAKSFFTVAFPEYWLFALGAIFIGVTLFMPRGVLGVLQRK